MARVVSNGNIAAAATLNQSVKSAGSETLTVIAVVGTAANAATAAADVSVNVIPFLDDGGAGAKADVDSETLTPLNLPTVADGVAAAVLASNRAYILARYRVAGFGKVQIQAKNNNAAAKPVEINYFLS